MRACARGRSGFACELSDVQRSGAFAARRGNLCDYHSCDYVVRAPGLMVFGAGNVMCKRDENFTISLLQRHCYYPIPVID